MAYIRVAAYGNLLSLWIHLWTREGTDVTAPRTFQQNHSLRAQGSLRTTKLSPFLLSASARGRVARLEHVLKEGVGGATCEEERFQDVFLSFHVCISNIQDCVPDPVFVCIINLFTFVQSRSIPAKGSVGNSYRKGGNPSYNVYCKINRYLILQSLYL